jgi:hypothetical protein
LDASLGPQEGEDEQLLWIAKQGIVAPLPEEWKACEDDAGEVFYFNFSTGESMWDHPSDALFKQLVLDERAALQKKHTLHTANPSAQPCVATFGNQGTGGLVDEYARADGVWPLAGKNKGERRKLDVSADDEPPAQRERRQQTRQSTESGQQAPPQQEGVAQDVMGGVAGEQSALDVQDDDASALVRGHGAWPHMSAIHLASVLSKASCGGNFDCAPKCRDGVNDAGMWRVLGT